MTFRPFPWLLFSSSFLEFAKAFLYLRLGYVPKVPSSLPWPVMLQAFCPPPFWDPDQEKLQALDMYVQRAVLWRKTDQLFICFGPPKEGLPATKQTISRWIVDAISLAYESSDLPSSLGVRAHSTRWRPPSHSFPGCPSTISAMLQAGPLRLHLSGSITLT